MVDIKILWPEAYLPTPSSLPAMIVVDEGACAAPDMAISLRRAVQEFDEFIGRTPWLAKRLDCTLITPRSLLSGVELANIRSELTVSEASARSTVAANFHRLTPGREDRTEADVHRLPVWLVILSGGRDTGHSEWPTEIPRLLEERQLIVIPVIVGRNDDETFLSSFGPSRPALTLQQRGASRLFSWLGKELVRAAGVAPGSRAPLDVAGIAEWAQT